MAFRHPLQDKDPVAAKAGPIEAQIRTLEAELKAVRLGAKTRTVEDYALAGADGEVSLSQLFGGKDELVLVHNMGASCPYCTMWANGINGSVPDIEARAAFALASPDAPDVQKARVLPAPTCWRITWRGRVRGRKRRRHTAVGGGVT